MVYNMVYIDFCFFVKFNIFAINIILTHKISSGASKIGFSIEIRFSGTYSHVVSSCLAPGQLQWSPGPI